MQKHSVRLVEERLTEQITSGATHRRSWKGKFRLFGHFVLAQFLLLAVVEYFVLVAVSYSATHFLIREDGDQLFAGGIISSIVIATVLVLSIAAMGLYDARQREALFGIAYRLIGAFAGAFSVLFVLHKLYPSVGFEIPQLAVHLLVLVTATAIIRALFYKFVDGKVFVRRVLVIGTGRRAQFIDKIRRKADKRGFDLKGFVAPKSCQHIFVNPEKLINVGSRFCEYALEHDIDEIVIALDDRRQALPVEELLKCRMSGIAVIDALDFFERERALIHLELLQPGWLIHAGGFNLGAIRSVTKRFFDILISVALLAVSLPLQLVVAVMILLESKGRGSVFYKQRRVGRHGATFDLIKFRSMKLDAEADGRARWATKDDLRVTRVGRVIRRYRLDELPQLWNVLIGDMSMVGPRPERPEFVSQLSRANPLYVERHRVKPGITGWAQLCYPYGSSEKDSIQKLQYDLYYVKNHTLFFDLYILVETVEVVLFKKGSR